MCVCVCVCGLGQGAERGGQCVYVFGWREGWPGGGRGGTPEWREYAYSMYVNDLRV